MPRGRDVLDLDRRLCAIVRPRFVAGGHEYVGHMVSWEQAVAWGTRAEAVGKALAKQAPGAEAQLAALVGDMARELFPAPPAPPWWRRWSRVPAAHEVVAGLHDAKQSALLYDLFLSFCAALATMMPQNPAPTASGQTASGPATRPTTPPPTTTRGRKGGSRRSS